MDKKYTVNEAIWIATALMAAEMYSQKSDIKRTDIYFKQADIRRRAQILTDGNVDAARVSWWTNADAENHTQNYLRGDLEEDETARRLSMLDEFPEKTYPENLDTNDIFDMGGCEMTMEELFFFVREQYPEIVLGDSNDVEPGIDYIGVLAYLENNYGIPYSKPESPEITPEKKEELLQIKKRGQNAVSEMKRMADYAAKLYKLGKCIPGAWLDQTGKKTKKYLWTQTKYAEDASNPISVSIFVERNGINTARFRVSLEIKNDGTNKEMMDKYHQHLNVPKNTEAGLVYVSGSNEWGNPTELKETQSIIKAKVQNGTYKKVQICKYIEQEPDKTNAYYHQKMMKAIRSILPYYDFVLGKKTSIIQENEKYWPTLEEYNPGIKKEMWAELLRDDAVTSYENLRMFKMMLELGGESTCANLAETYGGTAGFYNSLGRRFGERVQKKVGCHFYTNGERKVAYIIPFMGRTVVEGDKRRYSWKLRPELKEALEEMDLSGIDLTVKDEENIKYDKNIILYGPPGTGKTYSTVNYAVAIIENKDLEQVQQEEYQTVLERYHKYKTQGFIEFTTFHQSYGYEEFIEGIKPKTLENEDGSQNGTITYSIEPGVFKRFCDMAKTTGIDFDTAWEKLIAVTKEQGEYIFTRRTGTTIQAKLRDDESYSIQWNGGTSNVLKKENIFSQWQTNQYSDRETIPNGGKKWMFDAQQAVIDELVKTYGMYQRPNEEEVSDKRVFIIDEINRGNISKIFGELITLIETSKRQGQPEGMTALLPYSQKPFGVPDNIYILGTMNTADRSIALMDTALRRRFQFIEMMPDINVLRTIGADKVNDLDVAAMLEKMNERITFLYDREHTIGHAFFTKLAEEPTIDTLRSIFEKSVIPLLQEYFYEDYQKIQLVLGDNGKRNNAHKFILDSDVKVKDIFKGSVDDVIDLPEKKYTINTVALANIESYKEII